MTSSPSIGSIVHYVLPANGKHRPAIIVKTYPESINGQVNLLVFKDGANDGNIHQPYEWATAINQNEQYKTIGTWHYSEQAPQGSQVDVDVAALEQRIIGLEQSVSFLLSLVCRAETPGPKILSASANIQPAETNASIPVDTTRPMTEHRPTRKR